MNLLFDVYVILGVLNGCFALYYYFGKISIKNPDK